MVNSNTSEINKKLIANAISAYFLVFISWLFFFNKTNIYINNDFVKSHAKSSTTIHIGFLLTYIVFVHFSLFSSINYYQIGLNILILKTLFLFLFGLLVIGSYKAYNKKHFFSENSISFIKKEKIIDINNDNNINEKDKLTILISYIPFLGFYNYPLYKRNTLIKNITKLNLITSIILLSLYLNNHYNLSNLILLFYTIFVVFIGINLFTQNNIININLTKLPTINKLNLIFYSIIIYLKNYFKKDNNFNSFKDILNKKSNDYNLEAKKQELNLKNLKSTKLPNFLIYIPIINLIFLFSRKTAQKTHISNGLIISLLLIIIFVLKYFNYYNNIYFIFFIIPIIYGIGYLQTNLYYKMPFIYEIHIFISFIFRLFIFKSKKINKIRKKDEIINLKVGE